jgi:hypothetical protein
MSATDFDAIRADLAAASPGPWFWGGYKDSRGPIELRSRRPGWGVCTVMGFRRLGMNGAQPMFWTDPNGLLVDGRDVAVHNPNARLIAKAPEYIAALLAEVDRLRVRAERAEADADRLAEALFSECMCGELAGDRKCLAHEMHAEAVAQR